MIARVLVFVAIISLSAAAAAQQAPARDSAVTPTVGTGSISGTVVNDDARPQPVRRAIVSLTGAELRPGRGAITDDDGRFTIGGLPAGRFTLTVTRSSYVTSVYGAKRPGRPGTAISVADGQRVEELVVRLWRGAAIGGVLRDDTGAPVEGIAVTAIPARAANVPGILTLSNNGTTTNELGEYRIFGLEPSTYVVIARPASGGPGQVIAMADAEVDAAFEALRRRAAPGAGGAPAAAPPPSATQARPFDYAPIYFPGTPVLASATQITLAPGQEQTGLDFALLRVATSTVTGAVTRPDGSPAGGATLQLTAVVPSGAFASGSPLQLNATSLPDGTFRINQVTPGEYRLIARAPADPRPPAPPTGGLITPGPTGPQLWATSDLSVAGSDVTGVTLALESGMTIAGTVRFVSETLKPPADLTRLRIVLVPPSAISNRPGTSVTTIAFVPPVNLRADGSFEIAGLAPGTYRLLINGLEGGSWWPQSATIGGRDLFDGDLEITRAMASDRLLVTYSDQHSELSGTLQTPAGAPASDVVVIAFATDRSLWGSGARRTRAARPAADGRFEMTLLPPGDYFLAALTDVDQDEWQDPGFLDRVIPSAIKISIAPGEKKVQDLRLGR
jgi:Carboxypeptidase regulatory-like domain